MVGADKVATGHYARVEHRAGRWRLLRGVDRSKDQSYYLFGLTQEQLAHAVFPLGELTKPQVRSLAAEFGLKTRDKPESQEICFVPEGDYRAVVAKHDPDALRPGPIVGTDGETLGEHGGIAGFTIGQRRGLGVTAPRPLYVVGIQPETNTVVVGEEDDLAIDAITVARINWIGVDGLPQGKDIRAIVKVRYRHDGAPATLTGQVDGTVVVRFDEPIRSAAPGQCAVFYAENSDEVIGGGWIE
jgi:tRNA-specific 2-thiouridylase